MASNTSTLSSIVDANRKANGHEPVRLTEPGTPEAAAGISMQAMIQKAIAEAMATMVPAMMAAQAPQVAANAAKNGKSSKPTAAVKPAGPWHVKPCERWGIDAKDAMLNDHVLITRNPEPKYGAVFMLIRGKSKPVCFNPEAFGNLVASCGLMGKFAKDYASYLADFNAKDAD